MQTPGYQQTDAGLIPTDWSALQVRDVCRLINGRGFKPYEWSDRGLPIIRIQNLNGSGEFNYFQGRFDPKILVKNGQLLFAWSGSRGTSFGPFLWRGQDAVLNYHTWKVVPNSTVTKDYLYYALKGLTSFIEGNAHGASALVHTQKWEMEGFYLAVPPISVQRGIAEALRSVDDFVSRLEKLIAKKQAIRQGMMQQLLNGRTRLPGFTEPWREARIGDLFWVSAGGDWDPENCVKVRDAQHPYPVVANALTAGATQGYCSYYKVPGDTLTITGRGDVGHAAYRAEPFVPIVRLLALVPTCEVSSRFFAEYINYRVRFSLESTGVPQLTAPQVRPYLLAVPPIDEQRAIAAVLDDASRGIDLLRARLAKAQSVKQGMMQEILTGRTRLPVARAPS
jgi:type I restriction enzyme, S subunit